MYEGMAWFNGMIILFYAKLPSTIYFCCILCFFLRRSPSLRLKTAQTLAVPLEILSGTMGEKAIRSEPQELTVSAAAREILEKAGWLNYFSCLQESNETVALEFLQNLQEDYSTVRGRRIAVTDDVIAEVSGLPTIGPVWTLRKERLQKIMDIFQDEGQSLTVKGKGVLPATLGEPWTELARIVQSYITCEGRKDVVRPRHLKLLAVLKEKCSVNMPALLNSLLHDVARSLKTA